jgi:Tol biopolymer transport system component
MNRKTNLCFLFVFVLVLFSGCKQKNSDYKKVLGAQQWEYFGQNLPGGSPELFSPNMISTSRNERDFAITPRGTEMYFTTIYPDGKKGVILYMYFDGFFWAEPVVAPFSGQYSDMEPALSPDGNKLFFVSDRPLNGNANESSDYNIWFVERVEGRWSSPKSLGMEINSGENESFPSVSSDGTLFFTAIRSDSKGKEDIYYSRLVNGKYEMPVNIGEDINTENYEFNAYIAPDKAYLLFSSMGREDGLGGGDLYVSHRINDTTWTKAKNLGPNINSPRLDYCPCVSPDGNFLFFTSNRISPAFENNNGKNFKTLKKFMEGVENGLGNIYWVQLPNFE